MVLLTDQLHSIQDMSCIIEQRFREDLEDMAYTDGSDGHIVTAVQLGSAGRKGFRLARFKFVKLERLTECAT